MAPQQNAYGGVHEFGPNSKGKKRGHLITAKADADEDLYHNSAGVYEEINAGDECLEVEGTGTPPAIQHAGEGGDGNAYRDVAPAPTTAVQLAFSRKDTVEVAGKGRGKVRFIGPDHRSGELKVGVRLNNPKGKNNGTVAGHRYFTCEENHGVLAVPGRITLVKKFTPK